MPVKLTTTQFIERSITVHGDKFTYTHTRYKNSKTPVIITCKIHGDITINPNNHINNGTGCAVCAGTAKKTIEQFTQQVQDMYKDTFSFSHTVYVNDNTKVIITCHNHGNFITTPSNILQGHGCPSCAREAASMRYRKSVETFIEQSKHIHHNKYDYSQVIYVNNSTPVTIICPAHGPFSQPPKSHTDMGCGCPTCRSSHGERAIRAWLEQHNVLFTTQQTFDGCKDKRKLRFDFYLPDHNVLIEYNGIQHYQLVPLTKYSQETLNGVQRKDGIKAQFAKNKGLQLIVIPYYIDAITTLEQLFINKEIVE